MEHTSANRGKDNVVKKKKQPVDPATAESLRFEDALARLELVVQKLEDGQTGLDEALARYEDGMRYLKQCHQLLRRAERKIQLLSGVDAEGNPVGTPFDEQSMSLEEKADSRSQRRSRPQAAERERPPAKGGTRRESDAQGDLF